MKKSILVFYIFLLWLTSDVASQKQWSLGVQTDIIKLNIIPGKVETFKVYMRNKSDVIKTFARLYIRDIVPDPSGEFIYAKPGTVNWSCSEWITLKDTLVTLEPSSNIYVEGQVKVPIGSLGSYHSVIMVEPVAGRSVGTGSSYIIATAVYIDVFIKGTRQLPKVEIGQAEYIAIDNEQFKTQVISVPVENTSNTLVKIDDCQAVVKNSHNNIIGKYKLEPRSDEIFPFSIFPFRAPLDHRLENGNYIVDTQVTFGSPRKQYARGRSEFSINNGNKVAVSNINPIELPRVTPDTLVFKMRSGTSRSSYIKINNTTRDTLRILPRIKSEYIKIFPDELNLLPKRGNQVRITVSPGKDFNMQTPSPVVTLDIRKPGSADNAATTIQVPVIIENIDN